MFKKCKDKGKLLILNQAEFIHVFTVPLLPPYYVHSFYVPKVKMQDMNVRIVILKLLILMLKQWQLNSVRLDDTMLNLDLVEKYENRFLELEPVHIKKSDKIKKPPETTPEACTPRLKL